MLLSSEPSVVCLLHQPPSQLGHSKMNCRLLEKCTKLFSSCLGSREYVLPIVLNSESFFSIKLIYRISHSSRRVVERQWVTAWQRSSKHVQQTLIKSRPGMRMEGSEGGRKRREDGWTSKWYLFLVQERQQPRSSTQPNSQRAITRQAFCLLRPNPSRGSSYRLKPELCVTLLRNRYHGSSTMSSKAAQPIWLNQIQTWTSFSLSCAKPWDGLQLQHTHKLEQGWRGVNGKLNEMITRWNGVLATTLKCLHCQ